MLQIYIFLSEPCFFNGIISKKRTPQYKRRFLLKIEQKTVLILRGPFFMSMKKRHYLKPDNGVF